MLPQSLLLLFEFVLLCLLACSLPPCLTNEEARGETTVAEEEPFLASVVFYEGPGNSDSHTNPLGPDPAPMSSDFTGLYGRTRVPPPTHPRQPPSSWLNEEMPHHTGSLSSLNPYRMATTPSSASHPGLPSLNPRESSRPRTNPLGQLVSGPAPHPNPSGLPTPSTAASWAYTMASHVDMQQPELGRRKPSDRVGRRQRIDPPATPASLSQSASTSKSNSLPAESPTETQDSLAQHSQSQSQPETQSQPKPQPQNLRRSGRQRKPPKRFEVPIAATARPRTPTKIQSTAARVPFSISDELVALASPTPANALTLLDHMRALQEACSSSQATRLTAIRLGRVRQGLSEVYKALPHGPKALSSFTQCAVPYLACEMQLAEHQKAAIDTAPTVELQKLESLLFYASLMERILGQLFKDFKDESHNKNKALNTAATLFSDVLEGKKVDLPPSPSLTARLKAKNEVVTLISKNLAVLEGQYTRAMNKIHQSFAKRELALHRSNPRGIDAPLHGSLLEASKVLHLDLEKRQAAAKEIYDSKSSAILLEAAPYLDLNPQRMCDASGVGIVDTRLCVSIPSSNEQDDDDDSTRRGTLLHVPVQPALSQLSNDEPPHVDGWLSDMFFTEVLNSGSAESPIATFHSGDTKLDADMSVEDASACGDSANDIVDVGTDIGVNSEDEISQRLDGPLPHPEAPLDFVNADVASDDDGRADSQMNSATKETTLSMAVEATSSGQALPESTTVNMQDQIEALKPSASKCKDPLVERLASESSETTSTLPAAVPESQPNSDNSSSPTRPLETMAPPSRNVASSSSASDASPSTAEQSVLGTQDAMPSDAATLAPESTPPAPFDFSQFRPTLILMNLPVHSTTIASPSSMVVASPEKSPSKASDSSDAGIIETTCPVPSNSAASQQTISSSSEKGVPSKQASSTVPARKSFPTHEREDRPTASTLPSSSYDPLATGHPEKSHQRTTQERRDLREEPDRLRRREERVKRFQSMLETREREGNEHAKGSGEAISSHKPSTFPRHNAPAETRDRGHRDVGHLNRPSDPRNFPADMSVQDVLGYFNIPGLEGDSVLAEGPDLDRRNLDADPNDRSYRGRDNVGVKYPSQGGRPPYEDSRVRHSSGYDSRHPVAESRRRRPSEPTTPTQPRERTRYDADNGTDLEKRRKDHQRPYLRSVAVPTPDRSKDLSHGRIRLGGDKEAVRTSRDSRDPEKHHTNASTQRSDSQKQQSRLRETASHDAAVPLAQQSRHTLGATSSSSSSPQTKATTQMSAQSTVVPISRGATTTTVAPTTARIVRKTSGTSVVSPALSASTASIAPAASETSGAEPAPPVSDVPERSIGVTRQLLDVGKQSSPSNVSLAKPAGLQQQELSQPSKALEATPYPLFSTAHEADSGLETLLKEWNEGGWSKHGGPQFVDQSISGLSSNVAAAHGRSYYDDFLLSQRENVAASASQISRVEPLEKAQTTKNSQSTAPIIISSSDEEDPSPGLDDNFSRATQLSGSSKRSGDDSSLMQQKSSNLSRPLQRKEVVSRGDQSQPRRLKRNREDESSTGSKKQRR